MTAELVCAAPFAPLRDRPDEASEQHTQVLFGDRLAVRREAGDWLEVTAPDGYRGYVQAGCAAPWDGGTPAHVIVEPEADGLYLGTWLSAPRRGTRPLAERRAAASGQALLEVARSLLATPYEWGGTTVRGIDCSGLVQTSLRSLGALVPRNADQQEEVVGSAVVPGVELLAGDLLCFGDHIAIAAAPGRIVHAYGPAGAVIEDALPADLGARIRAVRRPFP